MRRSRAPIAGVDPKLLVKEAARLLPDPSRRLFLRNAASVGGLALLTGCTITDGLSAETALRKVSEFNDWVQARLFNPNRLAQTYPESAITRPFPFNGFYPEAAAPDIDEEMLPADRRRPDREQAAVDTGAALRAAAGDADYAPHLRRRLERGRQMDGHAAARIPDAASARTRAPSMCTSRARRAIRARSTWRPRCIRRRR